MGRFHRARDQHAAAGRLRAVDVLDRLLGWMATYGNELATGRANLETTAQRRTGHTTGRRSAAPT